MIRPNQIDVLCNITKTVFLFFNEEDELLNKILNIFDLSVDFNDKKLIYTRSVDDNYDIYLDQAKKYYSKTFGVTPLNIPDYEIKYIEGIFEENFEKAAEYYSFFDCIGYTLILEDGRWILKKK